MQIRGVNFLMSQGLGFWNVLGTPAGDAECRWLLDICRGMRATHIILPTESLGFPQSGFTWDKLSWIVAEVRACGMTPVLWGDKWLLNAPPSQWQGFWGTAFGRFQTSAVYNISQEIDLMYSLGASPHAQKSVVLSNLRSTAAFLRGMGAPRDLIWAGGATREGTVDIGNSGADFGILTYTMYRDVQGVMVVPGVGILRDAEQLLTTQMRILQARTGKDLVLAEFGHYTTWSREVLKGELLQRDVLEFCIRAAKNAGCKGAALWTLVDYWDCQGPAGFCNPDNASYGVIKQEGGGRPKLGFSAVVNNW